MEDKQQNRFEKIVFFILLVSISVLFIYVLAPFFYALLWAVLIASVFAPLYNAISKKIANPNLCSSLTMVCIIICLIVPVVLLIDLLIMETIDIYQSFNAYSSNWMGTFSEALRALSKKPLFAKLHWNQAFLINKSQEVFKILTDYVFNHISDFTQNTILIVVQFAVMLYSMFFFIRDGKKFVTTIKEKTPVDNRHLDHFIKQFLTTAKSSLKFTFVIGGVQGVLGGLIFYITGIERALIWGVLMFALSIVPAVGSAIIWVPAGIIMLLLGNIWQGVTILLFCSIVITSVDNLLRPILMGRDVEMHSLLIFLSTLGGLAVFGFSGFILGPVIASLFLAIWKLFPEIYQKEFDQN